jgi:hypothetical protein
MPQGVAWLDEARKQHTGIYHLDLYADGDFRVQEGSETHSGVKGHIELNTRGELRLKAYREKVVQTPAPADPLFLRAITMRYNLAAVPAKPAALPTTVAIQPTAAAQATAPKGPPAPMATAQRIPLAAMPVSLAPPNAAVTVRPATSSEQWLTTPVLAPADPGPTPLPRARLGLPE